MTLEQRKNNTYFDQSGKQILIGDLLKVFHFRTANRIYYMYHVAVMEETNEFPVMALRNYSTVKPHYRMYSVCDNVQRIFFAAKIINAVTSENKRLKIKVFTSKQHP